MGSEIPAHIDNKRMDRPCAPILGAVWGLRRFMAEERTTIH